jgi:L-fucose isomerase
MMNDQQPSAGRLAAQPPLVGLLPVMDPRIDPALERKILGYLELVDKLRGLGVEVVWPGRAVSREEEAVAEAERMRAEGACGVIYFTCWFLRANVIAGACRHSGLPALLWSIPNLDDTSLIGFGVAHGSLDEAGYPHEIVCGPWDEASREKIGAWIAACRVKGIAARSRYGHVGGKCLSMMTADSDANQWRRQFGIDVDHAEQWTLIHEAEKVPDSATAPWIERWRREFQSVEVSDEVLARSARLYLAGREMFIRNRWDFAGVKCQFELLDNYLAPCLPVALWNDDGFVVACETDMNAALTMYVLRLFSGHPVMFSDIQYLNREERWARFLNCGTAAAWLAGGKDKIVLRNCPEIQGTYDETTGKHLCKGGACPHFVLPPGRVTLARFGRIAGRYVLHACRGESFAFPHDENSLLGIGAVWPFAYVKIEQDMERFVRNLRAHHMCIAPGDWLPQLKALADLWGVDVL